MPIIIVSADDDPDKVVEGIGRYAEDYIVKPFNPRELLVRVQRLLLRIGSFAYTRDENVIVVNDDLQVDIANQTVFVDGESVALTPTETKLLYILLRNAGQVVTEDFFLRRIWHSEAVRDNRLSVYIHHLRRKIEANRPYIFAIRGVGYVFREDI